MFATRLLLCVALLIASSASRADIYRWDTGAVIPGTEGIEPGPGLQLISWNSPSRNLRFANFSQDLSHSSLRDSWLDNARFINANLANADLAYSTLTNAELTGAILSRTNFAGTVARGFKAVQLYSTQSYQTKDLRGIKLDNNDLSDWNFSGQDLTNADLTGAKFTNATLTEALVLGANFSYTVSEGFTAAQLYSTESYQQKNLREIRIGYNDLTGWDFSGQNLVNAWLDWTELRNVSLSGALVTGTNFSGAVSGGFTAAQLYSTLSYQEKNLSGIDLSVNNLSGWDFSGQNLANGQFYASTLTGAKLTGAVVTGADFAGAFPIGVTAGQLYSTQSYRVKNLNGIGLEFHELTGWNFSGQNLTNARLGGSDLANADLAYADTRGVSGLDASRATTRNMIWPNGTIAGLNLAADDEFVVRNYRGDPTRWLAPIPIVAQGHMTIDADGALQLLFDADPWESLISFEPSIPVQLGGALTLTFADDVEVASQVGRAFYIFDWTGVNPTGEFRISSPYHWDTSRLYSSGVVRLTAVPEPSTGAITLAIAALLAWPLVRFRNRDLVPLPATVGQR